MQGGGPAGDDELDAEALGLLDGPPGELTSVHAVRKAGIVLDHRAVADLPAGDLLLDDDSVQSLRRRVNRGRDASGSAADDCEVVEGRSGLGGEAQALGECLDLRVEEDAPSGRSTTGRTELPASGPGPVQFGIALGVDIEPAEPDAAPSPGTASARGREATSDPR